MIFLYILLGVILLIFIATHISVNLNFNLSNDHRHFEIKYLFIKIYPLAKKDKKKKRKKKAKKNKVRKKKIIEKDVTNTEDIDIKEVEYKQFEKTKEQAQKTKKEHEKLVEPTQDKEKDKEKKDNSETKTSFTDKIENIKELIDKYKVYIPLAKKSVKKLLKSIRFYDIKLDLALADEDAYKAALNYGKASGIIYSIISLLKTFFTLKVNYINIKCRFNSDKSDYELKGKVKVRPSTIIALLVSILVNFLYTKYRIDKKENKKIKEND